MNQTEPQNLPNAGLIKRLLATLYDLFPLFGVAFLYTSLAMLIATQLGIEQGHLSAVTTQGGELIMRADEQFEPALRGLVFQLGLAISLLAFYAFFWMRNGQTLGMRAWRLRLIRADGRSLDLKTCLLRALLGVPSLLLFGLGYLWILFHPGRLALHDQLTGTRVIQLPRPTKKQKS